MDVFSAVSSSARQLFSLLRCIGFAQKAHVQISEDGLRFSVEDSRAMEGFAFLDKKLFTTFRYNGPVSGGTDSQTEPEYPCFQISLPALLETLQIFGLTDNASSSKDRWASREFSTGYNSNNMGRGAANNAFDSRVLGMTGLCRLSYAGEGSPLHIVIEENNVTTTCALTTYEPETIDSTIPFDRDRLSVKIIMRSSWLYDAMLELSSTAPTRLTMTAAPTAPFFSLAASDGALGSTAAVDFSRDPAQHSDLLETFHVAGGGPVINAYNFAMVRSCAHAMSLAAKVSIRCDEQGVLSLQFMIEMERGEASFVDFRFVPFVDDDDEDDGGAEDED